ncbi:VWA domain-containing protein [Terriglobus sp. TAA 43]|uniref:VWA domain-containing protein n=1 Tax=Terriglobus sp. TAA 43 TaxID=278961 RepID=UPI0018DB0008|nr:VWA domain-containing protein [Terriglobus sp. TAA 43]
MSAVLIAPLLGFAQQSSAPFSKPESYALAVSVKEVQIRFHANDASGNPVLDLRPEEIDVFDEGQGPNKVVSMQHIQDSPLHVAFVLDTSGSALSQLARSRRQAKEVASVLLSSGQYDETSVITFDRSRHTLRSWSHDRTAVMSDLQAAKRIEHNLVDGTSVYDTIFNTCQHDFDSANAVHGTNALLLFSDGVDTTSKSSLEAAIEACRKSETSIYAFNAASGPEKEQIETGVLRMLTEQTGGLLLLSNTDEGVIADLQQLASRLRSEYVLSFKPSGLIRNGTFHHIVLAGPRRVAQINATPGFYAPAG